MEEFSNGVAQSRVVLAKPRLGGFGSSTATPGPSKGCNPFSNSSSVLRPSQLKPGNNPFLKVNESKQDKETDNVNIKEKDLDTEEQLEKPKEEGEVPKFVPLGSNVAPKSANPVPAPAQQTTSSSSSGFVFGQNLSERVVIQENLNNGEASSEDHSTSNGTSDLLFTAAASATTKGNLEETGPSESTSRAGGGGSAGLAAAAAEYERSHARPLPPRQTHTLTGEEDEINVLQISCRLFAWESGSWRERGRGVLRLNDAAEGGAGAARLVARVSGSLRVVLNTKLWPEMVVERAGTKSLRITATDAQHHVKLFLIMAAPADIAQLSRALTARIAVSKRTNVCEQNATSQQAAERLEAATDDDEFLKPESGLDQDRPEGKDDAANDKERLNDQKTDESQENQLKRKDPVDDDTSPPKRQCPKIVID